MWLLNSSGRFLSMETQLMNEVRDGAAFWQRVVLLMILGFIGGMLSTIGGTLREIRDELRQVESVRSAGAAKDG